MTTSSIGRTRFAATRPDGEVAGLAYRAEIDGLRGIAVSLVALYHAQFEFLPGGYVGVDVFFVISGYLITSIILADIEQRKFSFAYFYERRARRLLPALYFYTFAAAAIAWIVLSPSALKEFGRHLVGVGSFSANFIYWLDAGYFATRAEHLPLIHTWSLAVEEQFYFAFPLMLFTAMRYGVKRALFCILLIAVLSLCIADRMSSLSNWRDAAFYLLLTRAWELLAGSLLVFASVDEQPKPIWWHRVSTALSLAGVVGVLLAAITFDSSTSHPSVRTLLPVLATCLVVAFARRGSFTARLLSFSPLLWIGLASYSFYLAHQPILAFARIELARPLSSTESIGLLLLALIVSAFTWRFIEQPFRARKRISGWSVCLYSVGGAAFLILAGAVFWSFDGFPGRMDASVAARLEQIRAGGASRAKGIRLGSCQWNKNVAPDVDDFLARWDCFPVAGSRPRILVVGDSISADKAWILREAGFDVANLGGAACPLVPAESADEPCWKIMSKARSLVRAGAVDGIVLGRNWYGPVAAADVKSVIEFWSRDGVGMLVFSGMPVYQEFKNKVVKHIKEGTPLEEITFDDIQYEAHIESLAEFRRQGISVVDSRALLCGEKRRCGAYLDGAPLVGDPTHLQPAGVRVMAKRLAGDPAWNNWYRSLPR